jgi:hypothetical protein
MHEKEAVWRVVVDLKYGSLWGGWCSNDVHGSYEVGIWKNIRRGWVMPPRLDFGMMWCGYQTLKVVFSRVI